MTTTPNMSLVLPVVGSTPGPTYGTLELAAFSLVDSHDHTSGNGVLIPVAAMNINADFPLNSNNLNAVQSLRLNNRTVTPVGALDVRVVYSKNGELAYRDAAGNEVVLTASGSIAGASGTITGLVSPASAVFSPITGSFSLSKDSSKPGKLAISDINIYEYNNASANAITIKSPAALGSSYTLTLPASVAAAGVDFLNIDGSGVIAHATLTGTASQVTVTQSASAVNISLPATVATTTVQAGSGSVSAPSFGFSSETNAGMYRYSAGVLGFATGGVLALNMSAAAASFSGSLAASGLIQTPSGMTAPFFLDATLGGGIGVASGSMTLQANYTTIAQATTSGLTITTGGLQTGSGGYFKVQVFTGSIAFGGSITLTAPSGNVLAYFGRANENGAATRWNPIQGGKGLPSNVGIIDNTNAGTQNTVQLYNSNTSGATLSYSVVMFYN